MAGCGSGYGPCVGRCRSPLGSGRPGLCPWVWRLLVGIRVGWWAEGPVERCGGVAKKGLGGLSQAVAENPSHHPGGFMNPTCASTQSRRRLTISSVVRLCCEV